MIRDEAFYSSKEGFDGKKAQMLANLASKFESQIFIEQGSKVVNGKSMMGILSLGNAKIHSLSLAADGKDQAEALDALKNLIESGFKV